jgi:hypothetical protein
MVTPLDIVDTAVKIGLGALISGVAAYFIAKLNHDREAQKAQTTRKRDLLEGIAEQVESFTHTALKYWALTRERATYERDGDEMPETRFSEWQNISSVALRDSYKEMTNAEAKLLLLGEDECQKLLREYGEYVSKFKSESYSSKLLAELSEAQIQEYRKEILAKRSILFTKLSSIYQSLHK